MKKADSATNFLGFKFVITPKFKLLKSFVLQVQSTKKLKIAFTPNPEQLVYAKSHSKFAKILVKADFLLPDGIGIVIGSQILSAFGKTEPILERVTGVDVVSELLNYFGTSAELTTDSVFQSTNPKTPKILIVGGRDYDGLRYDDWKIIKADEKGFGNNIKSKYKETSNNRAVKYIYWHEAFLNVSQPTREEENLLIDYIKKLKPDVVFVAFGAPHQEQWLIDNKETLEATGVRFAMVVGGAFDMLLGKVDRAPKWLQRIGLEWLFRLFQEPWRWRRQINLMFFIKMIAQEALK